MRGGRHGGQHGGRPGGAQPTSFPSQEVCWCCALLPSHLEDTGALEANEMDRSSAIPSCETLNKLPNLFCFLICKMRPKYLLHRVL